MTETEHIFRELAPKLQRLKIDDVLYGRFQSYGKPEYSGPQGEIFAEVNSPRHTQASLLTLLSDKDPKVRTLALAGLYAKFEPQVLPSIVAMVNDKEPSYLEPLDVARAYGSQMDIPTRATTVGEIAQRIVRFYLESAGFYYGIKGSGNNPGFDFYWQQRKNRKYCASWLAVALKHASTGCTPTDKTRLAKIESIRKQLDKIPLPDRDWLMLWLQSCDGFSLLANEQDLLAAMKRIGPDKLLLMLQQNIPCNDPDVQARKSNNFPYKEMQNAVLKRARLVLRKDQAAALIRCDRNERDYQRRGSVDPLISPIWISAAAQLDSANAEKMLEKEFNRLDEDFYGYQKAALAYALYQACGMNDSSFLLDRFYNDAPAAKAPQHSFFRSEFIRMLPELNERAKPFLKALIADPRFNDLNDSSALTALSSALVQLKVCKAPPENNIWHPLGLERACDDLASASKQYPKETKALMEAMFDLRKYLRANCA